MIFCFQNSYSNSSSRRINFDSTGDVRRSPITAIPGSTSECIKFAVVYCNTVPGWWITVGWTEMLCVMDPRYFYNKKITQLKFILV